MALRMKKGPNQQKLFPAPRRNTERQRTTSAYSKSTIKRYTNVPALTSSKFTFCCIMRNHFDALDTWSKTAPKRRNEVSKEVQGPWSPLKSQLSVRMADFWKTTCAHMSSWWGAFFFSSWLRKATGPPKLRRHFSYIYHRIKLLSTDATVSKCP